MLGRIAKYELMERIGEGRMGVVFRARDARLGSALAVKILREEFARDAEYRARFEREASAAANIQHAAIANCFDMDEALLDPPDLLEPGSPGPHPASVLYLAMEYVPGTDLTAFVRDPPTPLERVLDLTHQIAAGLESAHRAKVIHRDLKPSNVRVTPEGQVKIVDFGLSRIERPESETLTLTNSRNGAMGTPFYMAPELWNGHCADQRSDLFSLGVITYQLITGKLPFVGETVLAIFTATMTVDPPPLTRYASNVPGELERVVRKLIAKDPEERYQSAHEVGTDLRRLQEAPPPRPGPWWRRWLRRAARPLAYGAVALALVLGAWWVWHNFGPRSGRSVAVMPFRNLTGDPRLDYLCEGIATGVVGGLVSRAQFNVPSISFTRDLDPKTRTAMAVSRNLGVRAVLDGTLRRQAGITYVDVQLVDGRLGYVLWTGSYQYVLENMMDIQAEIVSEVARRMTGRAPPALASGKGKPPSLSAYDLYLRAGPHLVDPDDPHGADQALELYAKALDVDRDFALAWVGQSSALVKIYNRDKDEASLRRAEEAADRAIRLNPELLEARLARAQIYRLTSRPQESIRELQDVLRSNPNWDEALIQLAASYRKVGNLAREEASVRRAVELRPAYWRNWNQLGGMLVRKGDYEGARAAYRKVIDLVPGENIGYENLAAIELREHNYTAAMALYERLPSPVNDGPLASNLGSAYFFERRLVEARRYYVLALSLEPGNYRRWRTMGDLHTREGSADSARADYAQALRLLDDELHVNPQDVMLRLDRAVCLAKSGQCAPAQTALRELAAVLPANDVDVAHWRAKLLAICGRREAALQELRRAVGLGLPPRLLKEEDEFAALAHDAEFIAITRMKKG